MLLQTLEQKVGTLFARIPAGKLGWFGGTILDSAERATLDVLHWVQAEAATLFGEGGTYAQGVAWLRKFLKACLPAYLPWYVRLMVSVDKSVDLLCDWLLSEEPAVKAGIGYVQ